MELKKIYDKIKEARRMLGYNGGYGHSDSILYDLNKEIKKELVKGGEINK